MRTKRFFIAAVALFAIFAFVSPVAAAAAGDIAEQPAQADTAVAAIAVAGLTLKQLLDQRTKNKDEIAGIQKKAKEEKRDLTEDEETRCDELLDQCDTYTEEIEKRKKKGKREERLQQLEHRTNETPTDPPRGPEPRTSDPNDPVENPDSARFSVLRAIRLRAAGKPLDGYEAEYNQEVERRTGREAQGFFLPTSLSVRARGQMHAGPANYEQRDLTMTTGAGALQTHTTTTMIELLRNRMFVFRLGAQVLTDMVGDFDIPKQTAGGTAYWVTEGNPPTESNQTIGQVAFSPSTVGAFTDYTRKFTKQTSVDAENFVRGDLMRVLALELDRVGLNGSGSGAEPEGILQNSSVPTVAIGTDGGAPTWATVVDMETEVSQDNADMGTLAYLTTAQAKGKLKQVAKDAGSGQFLWQGGEMNGYPAFATQQLPANLTKGSGSNLSAAIFGDFAALIYSLWGAVDVLVDPYTASSAGTVRIVTLQDADLQLRHTEAFSKCVDIDPAA